MFGLACSVLRLFARLVEEFLEKVITDEKVISLKQGLCQDIFLESVEMRPGPGNKFPK